MGANLESLIMGILLGANLESLRLGGTPEGNCYQSQSTLTCESHTRCTLDLSAANKTGMTNIGQIYLEKIEIRLQSLDRCDSLD